MEAFDYERIRLRAKAIGIDWTYGLSCLGRDMKVAESILHEMAHAECLFEEGFVPPDEVWAGRGDGLSYWMGSVFRGLRDTQLRRHDTHEIRAIAAEVRAIQILELPIWHQQVHRIVMDGVKKVDCYKQAAAYGFYARFVNQQATLRRAKRVAAWFRRLAKGD